MPETIKGLCMTFALILISVILIVIIMKIIEIAVRKDSMKLYITGLIVIAVSFVYDLVVLIFLTWRIYMTIFNE